MHRLMSTVTLVWLALSEYYLSTNVVLSFRCAPSAYKCFALSTKQPFLVDRYCGSKFVYLTPTVLQVNIRWLTLWKCNLCLIDSLHQEAVKGFTWAWSALMRRKTRSLAPGLTLRSLCGVWFAILRLCKTIGVCLSGTILHVAKI